MSLNNFRLRICLRVFLLTIWIFGFVYSIHHIGWIVTPFILFVAIILSVCELIHYQERTNRDFTNFLLAIRNSDFSRQVEQDSRGKTFTDFRKALNTIVTAFHQVRTEKEANYIFLQTVVADLNTGLLCFDETGSVKLMNEAARQLLHLPHLKNIRSLAGLAPKLGRFLQDLKAGGALIVEVQMGHEQLKLSGRAVDFNLQGIPHKLVSFHDIRTEMDAMEMDAWEQLLRVLTHEIMNSMAPISSLSETLKKKANLLLASHHSEAMNDVSEGLHVIAKRSEGLIHFVNHYKTLINLPAPEIKLVNVNDLFARVLLLKDEWLRMKGIQVSVKTEDVAIFLRVDPEQMEQVLINVINNAVDAMEHTSQPMIALSASQTGNKIILKIVDNGKGIDADITDKLFIPFFSTKKKGSGIGLSLSKQLTRKNGGSIGIHSSENVTTCFLEFTS